MKNWADYFDKAAASLKKLLDEPAPSVWDRMKVEPAIEPMEQTIAEMKDFCDWLKESMNEALIEPSDDSHSYYECLTAVVEQLKERGLWVE